MSQLNPNPYPVIQGIDGLPLDDGYVYIGTADLDPATNPKTVYWDVAQTLPVVQPIRTALGRIWNGGSIAAVYLTGNYSLRVLDKNGAQVFINLNVTPF